MEASCRLAWGVVDPRGDGRPSWLPFCSLALRIHTGLDLCGPHLVNGILCTQLAVGWAARDRPMVIAFQPPETNRTECFCPSTWRAAGPHDFGGFCPRWPTSSKLELRPPWWCCCFRSNCPMTKQPKPGTPRSSRIFFQPASLSLLAASRLVASLVQLGIEPCGAGIVH